MYSIFLADAAYYNAATEQFRRAHDASPRIDRKLATIERLQSRFEAIPSAMEEDERKHDWLAKKESLAIRLESKESELGNVYAPAIQGWALTHILCAASLEAHINWRGEAFLAGAA